MSGIPAWAVRGARVICIHRGEWRQVEPAVHPSLEGPEGGPDYSEICVITKARVRRSGVVGLMIEGWSTNEYHIKNFRPAVEPKSEAHDLALFRDLIRQPERA